MNKLVSLYHYLKKIGQDQEAEELRRLMQETEEDPVWQEIQNEPPPLDEPPTMSYETTQRIEGRMPKFDWLLKGNLFKKIYKKDQQAYLEFLNSNSHSLVDFNEPSYLGSGAMADTWMVDGERVLKIFDVNSFAGNQEPSMRQYQNMYSAQWYDRDDEALKNPMIYGLGMFDTPYRITQMRLTQHSRGGAQLGWVLMEKVVTIDELTSRYVQDSAGTLSPTRPAEEPPPDDDEFGDDFDWGDMDDWLPDEENPEFKMEELYQAFANSYQLREGVESRWGGDYQHVPPEELIKTLVHAVLNDIIWHTVEKVQQYEDEEYEQSDMYYEYDDHEEGEEAWEESRLDLEDEEELESFVESTIEEMVQYGGDGESVVNEETMGLVERILGINQRADLEAGEVQPHGTSVDWLKDVVMEAIRKTQQGYGDTHTGNFGFRKEVDEEGNYKNRPIFFDA